MLKTLVVIPIGTALLAGVGYATCRMLGYDPHAREMLFAAGACLVAGELAVVPLLLTRGATQPTVAQASLVATMIQLFGSALLGGGAMMVRSLGLGGSMAYWLLAFYWLTLILLSISAVNAVKAAPVATAVVAPGAAPAP